MELKWLIMKCRNPEHRGPVVSRATYRSPNHKADRSVNLGY